MAIKQSVTRMWVHCIAGELATTATVLFFAAVTPVNPVLKWTFIALGLAACWFVTLRNLILDSRHRAS